MTTIQDPITQGTTRHPTRRTDRLLGAAAVASVAVTVAVLLLPHAILDETDPTAGRVTSFFTEHYTMQQLQPLLHSVGAVLLLVFLVRLATLLRELGGPDAANVVRTAGAAVVAMIIVTMGWVASVVTLTGDVDGTLQWDLYNIGWDFHFRLMYLLPLVLLPSGWVLRRSGAAVVGWFGLVAGALTVVAPLGYLGEDTWFVEYPGFMLFLLWTLVAGVALGFRGVRGRG